MTITIELTPEEDARLQAAAQQSGVDASECARRLVTRQLPPLDAQAHATLALLQQWEREDQTADPEAIRQAEEDMQEFERSMNAPRLAAGSRPLYP
jgi:hypothetical protein